MPVNIAKIKDMTKLAVHQDGKPMIFEDKYDAYLYLRSMGFRPEYIIDNFAMVVPFMKTEYPEINVKESRN